MSTANLPSSRLSALKAEDITIDEANNSGTNADSQTPGSGLFIVPSTVAGRAADVTGFLCTSANEYGKLEFSDPDGFLSLNELSDVTITTATTNDILSYDGTVWVNQTTATLTALTLPTSTVTQLTSLTTGVTLDSAAGTITTVSATTAADAVESFTVTNSAVLATSKVLISINDYTGASVPVVSVSTIAAGSFVVNVGNAGAALLDDVLQIAFMVV
jgi:hypothetical protein